MHLSWGFPAIQVLSPAHLDSRQNTRKTSEFLQNFGPFLTQGVLPDHGGAWRLYTPLNMRIRSISSFSRPVKKGEKTFFPALLACRGLCARFLRDPVGGSGRHCRIKCAPVMGLSGDPRFMTTAPQLATKKCEKRRNFCETLDPSSCQAFCAIAAVPGGFAPPGT